MLPWKVLKLGYHGWKEDKAPQWASAIAYYTLFSLAPLLLISLGIIGIILDQQEAQQRLLMHLQDLMGNDGAEVVASMLQARIRGDTGVVASIVGMIVLMIGATGVMETIQGAMNAVWDVTRKPHAGMWDVVRHRILSFGLVLSVGFVLLVSLVLSSVLSFFLTEIHTYVPLVSTTGPLVDILFSLIVTTALFTLLFKFLPDVHVAWKDATGGAFFTAILFTIGKSLIAWYVGRPGTESAYGTAGSVIVLLLWVNYSAQILLFGAECTKAYALLQGRAGNPNAYAERVHPKTAKERVQKAARILRGKK